MAFTDTPKIGVSLGVVTQEAGKDAGKSHALGSSIRNNLNQVCVYAQAAGDFAANLTTLKVNTTNFTVAGTGGSDIGPAEAVKQGDRFWVCTPAA